METSCYIFRRVVRANYSEVIVRLNEVRSTFISRKSEVHVIPKVKNYVIPVICKNSLTNFSSVINPTLIISKYSDIILNKFRAVKFTL